MLPNIYDVQCNCYGKTFKGQQYLDSHMKYKHPSATAETSHKSPHHKDILANLNKAEMRCSVLDDSPTETPSEPVVVIDREKSLQNKRRGSETRKSYTVDFKKKTIDPKISIK